MIRKFSISGLYSFGDDLQVVDFTAKEKSRLLNTKYEYNFNLNQANRPMKSAVFFGRNASGKTNLFLGIKILLNIIKYGLPSTKRIYMPNDLFNKNSNYIELCIEISDNNNNIFLYNITFDEKFIVKEFFVKNKKYIFSFENEEAKFLNKEINENSQKFLSKKLSDNIFYTIKDSGLKEREEFVAVVENIEIFMSRSYNKSWIQEFELEHKNYFMTNKEYILEIFKILDNSIEDFGFDFSRRDDNGEKYYMIHLDRDNKGFNYRGESDGTKKIIFLVNKICEVVKNGKILIIDELDSSISTLALIKILNELINTDENKCGQLIVSSHNVLLFDVSFLNSQQIFLVQKNDNLDTTIRSYYDYDIKSENKRAYIDYLKGHFDE